jgi:hypothetical protein
MNSFCYFTLPRNSCPVIAARMVPYFNLSFALVCASLRRAASPDGGDISLPNRNAFQGASSRFRI